jgi:hypothetical protein
VWKQTVGGALEQRRDIAGASAAPANVSISARVSKTSILVGVFSTAARIRSTAA